jgi:hypothetical protein
MHFSQRSPQVKDSPDEEAGAVWKRASAVRRRLGQDCGECMGDQDEEANRGEDHIAVVRKDRQPARRTEEKSLVGARV